MATAKSCSTAAAAAVSDYCASNQLNEKFTEYKRGKSKKEKESKKKKKKKTENSERKGISKFGIVFHVRTHSCPTAHRDYICHSSTKYVLQNTILSCICLSFTYPLGAVYSPA